MYKERDASGRDDLSQWMQEFHNPGDPWAKQPPDVRLHDGLLIVSGDSEETVSDKLDEILDRFGSSVEETLRIDGNVRPGDNRGREQYVTTLYEGSLNNLTLCSFGFKDNISQPALEGLDTPPTGKAPKMVHPQWAALCL